MALQFSKKVLVFQKTSLKLNVMKTFKISSDCHVKTYRSLKRRVILTSPVPFLTRIYVVSDGLKTKPLQLSASLC